MNGLDKRVNTTTLLTLLVVCQLAADSSHAEFVIAIEGHASNYVLSAESYLFDDTDGTVTVQHLLRGPEFDQGYQLHFAHHTDLQNYFKFDFGGPNNQPLAVGLFTDAQGYAGHDPAAPLLDVSGQGRGCSGGTGEYHIKEVIESPDRSTLLQLAVDLTFHCQNGGGPVRASIRLNSNLPLWDGEPDTHAGDDQIVAPAALVQLDGSASASIDNSPLSYQWIQTRGTPVVLDAATNANPTFIAPGPIAREYQFLEFQLTTTDTSTRSSSDTVIVTVSEMPAVQTLFNGEFGEGVYYRPARVINGPLDPANISWTYGSWYPSAVSMSYRVGQDDPVPERLDFGATFQVSYPHQFDEGNYYDSSHNFDGGSFTTINFGEEHISCSLGRGDFIVREAKFRQNGTIERLAVDFDQWCDGAQWEPRGVKGILRFNSAVPVTSRAPTAAPGRNRRVYSGDLVGLSANSSYSGTTPIASYAWQQTEGPPVSLSAADAMATTFVAPQVAAGTGAMAFDLTVSNDAGYSDTETVEVTVLGPDDPKNYARLFADPDAYDFVMWGEDRYFNDDNSIMSAIPSNPKNPRDTVQVGMGAYAVGGWNIELAPALGRPLTPGVYTEASDNRDENTRPYFQLTGNSKVCGDGVAEFIVHEVEQQPDGTVDRLALDFTSVCRTQPPDRVTTGIVRYKSTIPDVAPDPVAGISGDPTVTTGTEVILDSSGSYPGAAGIATIEWQQIGGPAVDMSDPHAPALSFTPDLAGTAPIPLQFQVTITTHDGRVSTATYTVTVIPDGVPYSAIVVDSEPGDFIGQGQNSFLDVDDVEFFVPSNWQDRVYVSANGAEYWNFRFRAPFDERLTPGNYESAYKISGPTSFPGMDVSGHHRSCLNLHGRFVVHEVEWRQDGTLDALAVDFLQHCGYQGPTARGSLRYNSVVPLRPREPNAAAGQDLVLPERSTVQLDGTNSSDADGQIVGYAWAQISGPAVTLDDPASAAPTFVAPELPQGTASIEFELTVADDEGNTGTDVVALTILDDLAPRNLANFRLEPGWKSMWGDFSFSDNNAFFFGSRLPVSNELEVDAAWYWRYGFAFGGPNNTTVEEGQSYTHTKASRQAGGAYMNMILEGGSVGGTGWFDIHEVQILGDELLTLAADFKLQPAEWLAPIVGSVRFGSAMPPRTSFAAAFANGGGTAWEGTSVVLDGLESYTTESEIVSYRWRVKDGPEVAFSEHSGTPSFVAPAIPGSASPVQLTIELEVEDDTGQIDTDEVFFEVRDNLVTGFPDDMLTIEATNRLPLGVTVDGGDLVYNEARSPTAGGDRRADPGQDIDYGVWLFRVVAPSGSAMLSLHTADRGFPGETRWTANTPATGWQEFEGAQEMSEDGKTLRLELVDGGADDLDGIANGIVEISGAPGDFAQILPPGNSPPPVPPRKNGGGGGSTGVLFLALLVACRWMRRAVTATPT